MVRMWAKIMKEDKIVKETILEDNKDFEIENYYDYVSEICSTLDVATPVILTKHIVHYIAFNNSCFLPNDFPETVDFDKLIIEEASL